MLPEKLPGFLQPAVGSVVLESCDNRHHCADDRDRRPGHHQPLPILSTRSTQDSCNEREDGRFPTRRDGNCFLASSAFRRA
jgi:hypothetical protein